MSEIAILVPVLNRPHRVEPLLESIDAATDVPHRTIFAASDQPTIDELERLGANYVTDGGGSEGTWPKRINRLYKQTNEPVIFTGADDLAFRPGWFEAAIRVMDTIPGGGVVAVNDLHNLAGVHFVIAKSYIEEFGAADEGPGVVMSPAFQHCYTDDFCRLVARFRDRYAFANDAIVEHLHVGNGKAPMDETYRIGEATMASGLATFQSKAPSWQ